MAPQFKAFECARIYGTVIEKSPSLSEKILNQDFAENINPNACKMQIFISFDPDISRTVEYFCN